MDTQAQDPPNLRDLAEPSADELAESRKRREAFERLKAQAAEHQPAPVTEPEGWEPPPPIIDIPPIQITDEIAPSIDPGSTDIEAEIRRAAFERVQALKADDPVDDAQVSDSEAEQQRQELESILSEPVAGADDTPWPASDTTTVDPKDPPDETVSGDEARRAEFDRFRLGMDAGVRETAPPYVADDPNDEITPPGGIWPAGPTEDPESQDWHDAFERLASERERTDEVEVPEGTGDPEHAEPVGDTPTASAGEPPPPAEEDLDMGSWHEAFQKLTAERDSVDAEPDLPEQAEPPVEEVDDGLATAFKSESLGDGEDPLAPTVDDDATSTFPAVEVTSDEGGARSEEFAQLQQQVSEPNEPPSSESALRKAEFERLRQEALGEGGPPVAPAPPEPASPPFSEATLGGAVQSPMPPAGAVEAPPSEVAPAEAQVDEPPDTTPSPEPQELDEPGEPDGIGPAQSDGRSSLAAWGKKGRELLARISTSKPQETTSVAVEHGFIKLLVTRGMDVLDYRIVPANPVLFREGLISDASRMAALLKRALQDLAGDHRRVVAAVPGYQTNLQRITLPNVQRMDPKVAIPSEARRTMGVSPESSHLSWRPLPGAADASNWLVVSATNRSVSSISAMADGAGLSMKAVELRPFAVARATNQPDAVFAWTAADGCDAVVVRDWVPLTYQSAYWGAGSEVEPPDLVNRITEVVESTIAAHNVESPEMSVSKDIPLFVYGSPTGRDESVGRRVAQNVGMDAQDPNIPLNVPDGFPVRELIVNIGLSLWED